MGRNGIIYVRADAPTQGTPLLSHALVFDTMTEAANYARRYHTTAEAIQISKVLASRGLVSVG